MKASSFGTLLALTLFFFTTRLFGQTPDSLGIDNKPILNRPELHLINSLLKTNQDSFDLTGRKIAFVTGPSGKRLISKSIYFKSCVKTWTQTGSSPQIFLVQLTEDEKQKSKGYDAIVLSWVKLFTNKQRRRIVTQLQSQTTGD